ncbi:MAG: thermonuclease family protein [Gemmatimonadota bacterium]
MRRILLPSVLSSAAFLPLPVLTAASAFPQTPSATCIVEMIVDGDTIHCGGERVRLLLIDAPEENQGSFGRAAQAFLEAILPVGSEAGIALDVERRDRYGRLLAYVYRPDGRMVHAMMVRQGFAVAYPVPPNVRHVDMIRAAGDSARTSGIGLYSVEAFRCAPDAFRDGTCRLDLGIITPSETPASAGGCHPSYSDVCIPPPPPDLDCADVPHARFRVTGVDPHRFDGNLDGVGCEGPPGP